MKKFALLFVAVLLICAACAVPTEEKPEETKVTTYVVRFVTNTDAAIGDVTVEEGKRVQSPATPENEGYKFEGWYTDASFSMKYNFSTKVRADLTLYAKWTLIQQSEVKWAGIRVSSYGMRDSFGEMPDVGTMSGFGQKMAGCYEGSTGTYLLIVGTMSGDDCSLNFPVSGDYDHIRGDKKKDRYEDYLDKFDDMGYSVWLQVEPGYADLETLVELVMSRYRHHSCVKGFGIDVEWHRPIEGVEEGTKLTDEVAAKVLAKLRTYGSDYTLFVKHWDSSWLPSPMDGLIYVDDWQYLKSNENAVNVFSTWASHFAPCPVMFQIGYDADEWLWSKFDNPAKEFGQMIADGCYSGNDVGIIWVDFTLDEAMDRIGTAGE